jgi:nucleotide-binding universal stress UspA family protein
MRNRVSQMEDWLMAERPVLIAHDGSPGSAAAIQAAGKLLGPRRATVATVWSPIVVPAPDIGGAPSHPAYWSDLEPKVVEAAQQTAEQGARLARDAGFDAEARTASGAPAWRAIVSLAEELDAAAIVIGARGLSGFKSALLGSTSNAVLHHAKHPVVVVPPTEEEPS